MNKNNNLLAVLAVGLLAGLAQAAPQDYTDRPTFDAALPGASTTLDFDGATANSLIPSGNAVGGITFTYALDGVSLKVSTESGSSYSTTSSAHFLGTDDADILQDGDTITLTFAPVSAIGLYVISNDTMQNNDVTLSAGGATANLLDTAPQGGPLGDGSAVYFLGVIDEQATFSTATLSTAGNGEFLFNTDDIVTAQAPDDDADGVPNAGDNCTLVANTDQRDTDGDDYGNICDPDFNQNGIVDPVDFSVLKSRFGQPGFPDQDLNGNGIVDPSDFSLLKTMFGQPPGPSGLVP
jgi:hypothetical protein